MAELSKVHLQSLMAVSSNHPNSPEKASVVRLQRPGLGDRRLMAASTLALARSELRAKASPECLSSIRIPGRLRAASGPLSDRALPAEAPVKRAASFPKRGNAAVPLCHDDTFVAISKERQARSRALASTVDESSEDPFALADLLARVWPEYKTHRPELPPPTAASLSSRPKVVRSRVHAQQIQMSFQASNIPPAMPPPTGLLPPLPKKKAEVAPSAHVSVSASDDYFTQKNEPISRAEYFGVSGGERAAEAKIPTNESEFREGHPVRTGASSSNSLYDYF